MRLGRCRAGLEMAMMGAVHGVPRKSLRHFRGRKLRLVRRILQRGGLRGNSSRQDSYVQQV